MTREEYCVFNPDNESMVVDKDLIISNNVLDGEDELTWDEALGRIGEGKHMITTLEIIKFLKYLRFKDHKAYLTLTGRVPETVVFLNSYFKEKKGALCTSSLQKVSGRIIKTGLEKLSEETLMEERLISLDFWLDNHTPQGLPKKDTPKGNLLYRPPKDDCVSVFGSFWGEGDTWLFCNKPRKGVYLSLSKTIQVMNQLTGETK